MFYDSSEEFRAVTVLALVAMVHEVENRISGIERRIEMKIILEVSLYRSYQVILSINKYYFQIVIALNFQQSIIMNILTHPSATLTLHGIIADIMKSL